QPGTTVSRGLPGVEGPVGTKGLKGDKGDMGRPGDPGCTDGANGEKGDTGGQGVQGPIGLKGNVGTIGPVGPPGPCSPTIQSAFSAATVTSFPTENQPIPFMNVIYNLQGNYNPMIGIYTAPVNGTYIFSFHLAVANKPLKVGLFRNLFPVIRTTEANNQATASQSVVLHLFRGDQLWLQVKNAVTNGIYTDAESSSTFSGYLFHAHQIKHCVFITAHFKGGVF
uniref:C1q domain-containing protein n=1 Tax=Anabas testudineus TaxID=64144 RepID=A0A3Q1HV44_ANATE